jgi:hypothetical protein
MIKFDISERGELIVDAKVLTISAFNNIYRSDKAPNKKNALDMLRYVMFMGDITEDNPHRDINFFLREPYAKKDVFGDDKYVFSKKNQELIDEAILWYATLNKDCVDRLSLGINKQIDELGHLLNTSEQMTMKNYKDRVDLLKDIKSLLISKVHTDEFVEKTKKKAKTKGDKARSPIEMGLILFTSDNEPEQ